MESMGYETVGLDGASGALALIRRREPSVVLVSHPSHADLMTRLHEEKRGRTAIVLSVAPKTTAPEDVARQLRADSFVMRPYRRETLGAALHAAITISRLRQEETKL